MAADRRRLERGVAALLFAATFAVLVPAQREMGIPRDESVYFDAGERYAGWLDDLARDPLRALSDADLTRRFELNHEHPAFTKLLFGFSHRLFAERLGWTSHRLGFRIPALLFSALLVALTFLLGARIASPAAGLFAALAVAATPRHFFHFQIAAFDVPVTTAWVLTVLVYRRSLQPGAGRRWAILAGLSFGLAVAIKHNAYFLPPLLVLHWLVVHGREAWRAGGWRVRLRRVPLAFPAMAVLGPAVLYVSWPYLWHHPFERFGWYVAFHAQHVNYSWEYLGEVLRHPPFPVAYPFVVTALTVPLPFLVPMAVGLGWAAVRLARGSLPAGGRAREAAGEPAAAALQARSDDWLLVLNALFPIALIALPSVPIFGGVKHWLPAMPFLAVLGGQVVVLAARGLVGGPGRRAQWAAAALAAILALPGAVQTAHFQPYGTSAYNGLAGGAPGAASLGMQRQFWSNAVSGVLPWLNENAPRGARVYFHEVTFASYRWYQRDGLLRPDLRYAPSVEASDLAAYQYHQEFRDREFEIWSVYGTRVPRTGLYLDEVPLVVVYARPGPSR